MFVKKTQIKKKLVCGLMVSAGQAWEPVQLTGQDASIWVHRVQWNL